MNTTFAIESFINYCDSMIIANESATGINKKYERFQKEMEKIKEEIKNEKDIDKIISLLNKEKSLVQQTKSAIMSEKEIGFKDSLKVLKSVLAPLVFGTIAIAASKSKELNKNDKRDAVVGFGGMALFSGLLTKFDIDKIKETKQEVVRALDTTITNINSLVDQFNYAKKQGAKAVSELDVDFDNAKVNKKRVEISTWSRLSKTIDPVKDLGNDIEDSSDLSKAEIAKYAKQMQTETIAFLKRYVNDSEFKSTFKKYLHMIRIHATDYAELFSVTITDYQDGIDYDTDDMNNDWYDELLSVGENFIEKRFYPWKDIVWFSIGNGDGDEGTIYVD